MTKLTGTVEKTDFVRLAAVVAVAGLFLLSGIALDGYAKSKATGSVLCLSCIKLEPKTDIEFIFETANGKAHPGFVLDALKTRPILIDYSQDNCKGCEEMHPYFVTLGEKYGNGCEFLYINIGHVDSATRETFNTYNILGAQGGTPMWVMVTLAYDTETQGVRPAFAVGYGFLAEEGDSKPTPEKGAERLEQLVLDGMMLYKQNAAFCSGKCSTCLNVACPKN
ncbi:MAG: hypothetical protein CVT48_02485 [Thermoplasmata archaeon HGW-Thermoplasmata-1]|nr:MAG: hypothetical protein CVT48_02485 [Thermoplasmata archaeon HGW-Thermoplasmata-1]